MLKDLFLKNILHIKKGKDEEDSFLKPRWQLAIHIYI